MEPIILPGLGLLALGVGSGFRLVPYLLLVVTIYILVLRQRDRERPPRLRRDVFALLVGTSLGVYDGFFGPGVGSLWFLCLTGLAGRSRTRTAANANVFDRGGAGAALLVFAGGGQIVWLAGLALGVGQIAGSRRRTEAPLPTTRMTSR